MKRQSVLYKVMPLICIVILVVAWMLPPDLLFQFSHITPLGLAALYICPVLAIIGLISSVIGKSKVFFALNLVFLFSFPLLMLLGNFANAIYAELHS